MPVSTPPLYSTARSGVAPSTQGIVVDFARDIGQQIHRQCEGIRVLVLALWLSEETPALAYFNVIGFSARARPLVLA